MKPRPLFTALLAAAFIAACGAQATPSEPTPDVAAVRTSAASTVVSQFTLTAAVFTPTIPAPLPTATSETQEVVAATEAPGTQATTTASTSQTLCDVLSYDPLTVDVNVTDNTVMTPGQDFVKTWKVKNTGSCPWGAGYVLAYANYDDKMSGQFAGFKEVIQPGQEVDVSVQFKAPSRAGVYVSAWSMRNPSGVFFEERIFVKIIVQ